MHGVRGAELPAGRGCQDGDRGSTMRFTGLGSPVLQRAAANCRNHGHFSGDRSPAQGLAARRFVSDSSTFLPDRKRAPPVQGNPRGDLQHPGGPVARGPAAESQRRPCANATVPDRSGFMFTRRSHVETPPVFSPNRGDARPVRGSLGIVRSVHCPPECTRTTTFTPPGLDRIPGRLVGEPESSGRVVLVRLTSARRGCSGWRVVAGESHRSPRPRVATPKE